MTITAEKSIQRKVITDNASEKLEITWDGERFALIHSVKTNYPFESHKTIILNPDEYEEMRSFGDEI